ncbi:MAG: hypothetical protein ACMXX5_00360 [Candidatus Woesearchaeota archaeon]
MTAEKDNQKPGLDAMLCRGPIFDVIREVNSRQSTVKLKPKEAYQAVARVLNGFNIALPRHYHVNVQYSYNPSHLKDGAVVAAAESSPEKASEMYDHFLLLNVVRRLPFSLGRTMFRNMTHASELSEQETLEYHLQLPSIGFTPIEFNGQLGIAGVLGSKPFMFKNEVVRDSRYDSQTFAAVFSRKPSSIEFADCKTYKFIVELM